jgi:anti-anti-sigma factor
VASAEGASTVVALRGEADLSTRAVLADALSRVVAFGDGDVVVDLAETAFIDSAGARTLAMAHQLLQRRDRALSFRSPSTKATQLLGLFGLTDLIDGRDGRDA